jgi:hypothetical protein
MTAFAVSVITDAMSGDPKSAEDNRGATMEEIPRSTFPHDVLRKKSERKTLIFKNLKKN